jgi:hypothetical protein
MKRSVLVALIIILATGVFVNISSAGLIMSVKAAEGTDYTIDSTTGNVTLNPGVTSATINMEVWASLSGNEATPATTLTTIAGGVRQVHGPAYGTGSKLVLPTTPAKGYVAPYGDFATQDVTTTDDLLGLSGATSSVGALVYSWTNATSVATSQNINVGKFTYDAVANGLGEIASINFVKPGSGRGNATFVMNGTVYDGRTTSGGQYISVGNPVTVSAAVPEPATLVLLGMGALAFVFIRRK